MKKRIAYFHLIGIIFIVVYSTYVLFKGKFELAVTMVPLLMVYYVFIVVPMKRNNIEQKKKDVESSNQDESDLGS